MPDNTHLMSKEVQLLTLHGGLMASTSSRALERLLPIRMLHQCAMLTVIMEQRSHKLNTAQTGLTA